MEITDTFLKELNELVSMFNTDLERFVANCIGMTMTSMLSHPEMIAYQSTVSILISACHQLGVQFTLSTPIDDDDEFVILVDETEVRSKYLTELLGKAMAALSEVLEARRERL